MRGRVMDSTAPDRVAAARERSRWAVVVLAAATVAAGVGLLLFLSAPAVTRANFDRIGPGMPRGEVRAILGRPEFEAAELGLVGGPGVYTTNIGQPPDEIRRRGFREYRREQWVSAEVTIVVVFGEDERVACKYSSAGEPTRWLGWLRALLP